MKDVTYVLTDGHFCIETHGETLEWTGIRFRGRVTLPAHHFPSFQEANQHVRFVEVLEHPSQVDGRK